MLGTILLVVLILAQWGYAPTGGLGLLALIVVILLLLGRL